MEIVVSDMLCKNKNIVMVKVQNLNIDLTSIVFVMFGILITLISHNCSSISYYNYKEKSLES